MGARLLRRWIHQPLLDAAQIRARLDAARPEFQPQPDAESAAGAIRERGDEYLVPAEGDEVRQVTRELNAVDIANLTPVQALVTLNEWQGRLRGAKSGD